MCVEDRKTGRQPRERIPSFAIQSFSGWSIYAVRTERWTSSTDDTSHSMDIYGECVLEGATHEKALSTVLLQSDIMEPRHAVGTSSGHFIILHSLEQDVGETEGSTFGEER